MLAIIALLAAGVVYAAWPRRHPQVVYVAPISRMRELKAIVNGTGDVQTKDSVDIQAEIAGVIIELPIVEGASVKQGDVLLRIDPFQTQTDVEAASAALSALVAEAEGQKFQVATAEANVARDEFLLKDGEVELRRAELNLARTREVHAREKRLLEANLTSSDQFEIAETQLRLDEAAVDAAKVRVQQLGSQLRAAKAGVNYAEASAAALAQRIEGARSTLSRAKDLFEKTTIRSPLTGTVVKLNVEVGERAVPGIQSNPIATLMTIADLRDIEAELEVDETDIVNVKMGDPGIVTVDALPDAKLPGTVIEIGNSPIAASSGTQEGKDFKVVLRIADPPPSLRPGMSCEADITTDVRADVLVMPIQALTAREVEVDAQGQYVPPPPEAKVAAGAVAAAESPERERKELQGAFTVGEDGRARFRPVKIGIYGEMDVEVLEGLSLGDEVVVGPLQALRTLEEHAEVSVDRSRPFRRSLRKGLAAPGEEEEE